jgi:hypothetical protein
LSPAQIGRELGPLFDEVRAADKALRAAQENISKALATMQSARSNFEAIQRELNDRVAELCASSDVAIESGAVVRLGAAKEDEQ